MPAAEFYRYLSNPSEIDQLRNEKKIQSLIEGQPNPQGTWYTPTRYEYSADAEAELALPYTPTHRIGPVGADMMPDFDIPLRSVAPANQQPGGGVEARTKGVVWLLGLYDFGSRTYVGQRPSGKEGCRAWIR